MLRARAGGTTRASKNSNKLQTQAPCRQPQAVQSQPHNEALRQKALSFAKDLASETPQPWMCKCLLGGVAVVIGTTLRQPQFHTLRFVRSLVIPTVSKPIRDDFAHCRGSGSGHLIALQCSPMITKQMMRTKHKTLVKKASPGPPADYECLMAVCLLGRLVVWSVGCLVVCLTCLRLGCLFDSLLVSLFVFV